MSFLGGLIAQELSSTLFESGGGDDMMAPSLKAFIAFSVGADKSLVPKSVPMGVVPNSVIPYIRSVKESVDPTVAIRGLATTVLQLFNTALTSPAVSDTSSFTDIVTAAYGDGDSGSMETFSLAGQGTLGEFLLAVARGKLVVTEVQKKKIETVGKGLFDLAVVALSQTTALAASDGASADPAHTSQLDRIIKDALTLINPLATGSNIGVTVPPVVTPTTDPSPAV